MPTTHPPRPSYSDAVLAQELDGGFSGAVTVTAATGKPGTPLMIFVDSEWLGRLMLTPQQAQGLAHALSDAADEG